MRLKPTTFWLALSALLVVVAVLLTRSRHETGPIVSGRPLSHWVNVIETPGFGAWTSTGGIRTYYGQPEYNQALQALDKNTDKAALQSLILDRIEAAYSPTAKFWHRAYFSIPTWLRQPFPAPRFGHVQFQTVELLDGIMPEPSARQRAAIQTMLGFRHINGADGAVNLVALSTATQTVPESIAFLRQLLATNDGTERVNLCETIRAKYKFDGWSRHREDVAGLLADLGKLATSDPNPDCRRAAHQALDKLTFELGASESAVAQNAAQKSGSSLTQASLFASPVQPNERPLVLDAPRAASELNLQLVPSTPTPGADPFKP